MKRYNPSEIEPKWQNYWQQHQSFEASEKSDKPKMYLAEMFPYPSSSGLHVGHVRNFMIVDVLTRFNLALGHNVMRPFGYDTFGLPAENYAIKTGTKPADITKENIAGFRNQAERLGFAIDWSREISTSDPEYYRWTQWIFARLFERGLAYKKQSAQWWCPFDKTVLANEQVENGRCWRCGNEVEKKHMSQWFFKITEYADELLSEIDGLDWPEKIKTMQRNWIGRSVGAELEFKVEGEKNSIKVFTTRPDTIFGATFLVLAPEQANVVKITTDDQKAEVLRYIEKSAKKSEIERQENKDKTGVFTGAYAINPATNQKIPIWIADYVLSGYGEGAIMAVPAHDERDYEFAEKFDLPITQVIRPLVAGEKVDNAVKRHVINAITRRPSDGKFLLVKWQKFDWISPVIGGIEDGETAGEAAEREVFEETGYKAKFVRNLGGEVEKYFFADNKNEWRYAISQPVLLELTDETPESVSAEEKAIQTPLWLTLDEALEQITHPDNRLGLELYQNGVKSFGLEGTMMNSGQFDGLPSAEAREKIVKWLAKQGIGREKVNYRMRDWLISRQRYWGCPIPIAYDSKGQPHLIPDDQLPVLLPEVDDYKPDDSGRSALAKTGDWLKVTIDGEEMTRETDTLDGYACSSWYLLRYADPHNSGQAWDRKKVDFWNPVDVYVGADHAVAHLLYVRFWTKVFADMGLLGFREPVKKLLYNGYVNGPDGQKMSKSKGNVVNPLDVIDSGYGADTLRTYELFIAPFEMDAPWDTAGVGGVYRFLTRVWNLVQEFLEAEKTTLSGQDRQDLQKIQHKTIKKVTSDLRRQSFNTAVAALMETLNYLNKAKKAGFDDDLWSVLLIDFVKMLSPFAPHLAAELFEQLGGAGLPEAAGWPEWDEQYLAEDNVKIAVQVNGKLRAEVEVATDADEATVQAAALQNDNVQTFAKGKKILKTIYVPNRILNLVVK
ncbi:MAG: leucine--tRNA ligase [Candidatus Nomurabacteria bacterium]|jgi:leucyl-tRNA synthetase|nr:leucine--tRNA ligase [Candidatus Nomurabacteria bacterium]